MTAARHVIPDPVGVDEPDGTQLAELGSAMAEPLGDFAGCGLWSSFNCWAAVSGAPRGHRWTFVGVMLIAGVQSGVGATGAQRQHRR